MTSSLSHAQGIVFLQPPLRAHTCKWLKFNYSEKSYRIVFDLGVAGVLIADSQNNVSRINRDKILKTEYPNLEKIAV